jgi:hypothetical protein
VRGLPRARNWARALSAGGRGGHPQRCYRAARAASGHQDRWDGYRATSRFAWCPADGLARPDISRFATYKKLGPNSRLAVGHHGMVTHRHFGWTALLAASRLYMAEAYGCRQLIVGRSDAVWSQAPDSEGPWRGGLGSVLCRPLWELL